ncbi:MAG: M48 family metallopeptidase [Sinobacteraceae bacterium]|nr:M48 family metallopeptidase [Nevskiaceae bacterium]
MDFYARQAAARGQTRWLVLAFIASLLAVALALDLVIFSFFSSAAARHADLAPLQFARLNPGAALLSTLLVMGVLGLASLYRTMQLRAGGGVVARDLGGVLVTQDTSDPQRRRLLNVVSEMAIASGVPMPEVYVLEQEAGINAFAAGHTPANAAISVTQGALDQLNRDQLQGVIGHEFSHILNGDMRLNVQLMGWVFGLLIIALIGRLIVDVSPRNRRGSNNLVVLGLAITVLGYVGLFLGQLMQAAVSRQRERLADASGVQFTRNPQGLKDALIKIAANEQGSRLLTPHAEQAAHMFFAPGLERLFATHPPLLERIREIDPRFDERELARAIAEVAHQPLEAGEEPSAAETSGTAAVARGAAPPPQSLRASVGRPDAVHIQHAQAIHLALPDSLREVAQSPGRAQALVLALLLSREPQVRAGQLEQLQRALGPNNFAIFQQLIPVADNLEPLLRLPALQQLFPALRRAPPAQRRSLGQLVNMLIYADARVDVFEFCLARLLESLLRDELEAAVPHGTLTLEDVEQELFVVFATLAQMGAADERSARIAYEAGMTTVLPMRRPEYAVIADWPQQLSRALARLEQLHPFAKQALIDGLVRTIASDEVMTEAEAELLRTVCALLHCPLPPLLGA